MIVHKFTRFLVLLLLTLHASVADDDGSSTETNEIIPRQAIKKLDLSVRQALLRAIDKLEQKAANAEALTTTTDAKDEILEESTSSTLDVVPTVQFFTATLDDKNIEEQPLSSFIDHSKIWKDAKKVKTLSPLAVSSASDENHADNRQTARSIGNAYSGNEIANDDDGSDEIKFEIRNSKLQTAEKSTTTTTTTTTRRPIRRRPTTTTTTTTTTPRPTHNEDGENIEIVDQNDIKILEAPLVTAFTVDLDERGTTKSVVPLLPGQPSVQSRPNSLFGVPHIGPTITKLNVLQGIPNGISQNQPQFGPAPVPTQPTTTTTTTLSRSIATTILPITSTASTVLNAVQPNGHYITKSPLIANQQTGNGLETLTPNNVNNFLLQKQRELEQQIYQLKLQAQQQQELIYRQLKLIEEQSKYGNPSNRQNVETSVQPSIQQQQQTFSIPSLQSIPLQSTTQPIQLTAQQSQQQQLPQEQRDVGFKILPSIEVLPSDTVKTTASPVAFPSLQQLPLKDSANRFNQLGQPNENLSNNQNQNNANVNNNFNVINNINKNIELQQSTAQSSFPNIQANPNAVSQQQQQPQNAATTSVQVLPSVSTSQFSFAPTFSTPTQASSGLQQQQQFQQPQQQFQQQQPPFQQPIQQFQQQPQQQTPPQNQALKPLQQPQQQFQQPQQQFQQHFQQSFQHPQPPQQQFQQPQQPQQPQNLAISQPQQSQPPISSPLQVSIVQSLPLLDYQQPFQQPQRPQQQLVPNYVSDAIKQQEQYRARQFRQELGTANLGSNQVQIQQSNSQTSFIPASILNLHQQQQQQLPQQQQQQQFIDNQNFYRQYLDPKLSNQLQQNAQIYQKQQQQLPALNHGIKPFAPPSIRGI